jgi:hypothetical protein
VTCAGRERIGNWKWLKGEDRQLVRMDIAFSFVMCSGDEHFFGVGKYVVAWAPRHGYR